MGVRSPVDFASMTYDFGESTEIEGGVIVQAIWNEVRLEPGESNIRGTVWSVKGFAADLSGVRVGDLVVRQSTAAAYTVNERVPNEFGEIRLWLSRSV